MNTPEQWVVKPPPEVSTSLADVDVGVNVKEFVLHRFVAQTPAVGEYVAVVVRFVGYDPPWLYESVCSESLRRSNAANDGVSTAPASITVKPSPAPLSTKPPFAGSADINETV